MQLRPSLQKFAKARPMAECAQCGSDILAPEWSEYSGEYRVRHLWACTACGYEFETLAVYPVAQKRTT